MFMDQSFRSKILKVSNGKPNKQTPIDIIEEELKIKSLEKGKKTSHPITWEKNTKKILKNSVCTDKIFRFFFNYFNNIGK